jgi:8-hydroxy-5-deazaflavin:NADPH oxidoreductase
MQITIVGSGHIGGGLGRAWSRAGHELTYATRGPSSPALEVLLKETRAMTMPLVPALAAARVVVLAVPFGAVHEVADALPDWGGRTVIDCTNAIGPGFTLLHGHTDSAAEVNARRFPGAHLVKCFNAQGAETLARPVIGGAQATAFFCGDDDAAKHIVRLLVRDVGFEPVDLGPLSAARFLEPMTLLWFASARALGTRQVAFKVLHE